MALPALEAMPQSALASQNVELPKRMAFVFVPNGVNLAHWTPKGTGFDYDLPKILSPLRSLKDEVCVLSGLTHDKGRNNGDGPGDHARCASVFLTGSQPRKTAGSNIRVGISVDQVAAQQLGHATPFPSLELGCEPGRSAGSCDSGYSCAYSSSISWSSPSTPVGKEINPRLVFERLFSGGSKKETRSRQAAQQELQQSILDFVSDDAASLRRQLGGADQRKLDEYLHGIREIERRLDTDIDMSNMDVEFEKPDGVPDTYAEHIRLMCDMMVLAFQSDMTRISTFMFANAGSNRNYRHIEIPDGHHSLSHHGNDPTKLTKIARINEFHVKQLAYLLGRLKSIREGEGSLLDQCMIVYGSGLSDGNRHNNENLPILLAGSGGGSITPGRHIRYQQETPMSNLYMSMLERFGCPTDRFGDGTGRLDRLSI